MGIRSMNFIAIKSGVRLTPEVAKYMNKDSMDVLTTSEGTLFVYESNFTPLWARDNHKVAHDLREEITVQEFLSSLNIQDYYMMRAGEPDGESDVRGMWLEHPFKEHESVVEIVALYSSNLREDESETTVPSA